MEQSRFDLNKDLLTPPNVQIFQSLQIVHIRQWEVAFQEWGYSYADPLPTRVDIYHLLWYHPMNPKSKKYKRPKISREWAM